MIDIGWNNTVKVVVPSTRSQIDDKEKKDLLLNLKKIKPEEISKAWDEIYYSWMLKKLKDWCDDNNLDIDLALYLIDKWHIVLLMKNIKKFDKKNYKEIVFKIIEVGILWDYTDKDTNRENVEESFNIFFNDSEIKDIFYTKETLMFLIDHGGDEKSIIEEIIIEGIDDFSWLDIEIIKKLKDNGISLKKIEKLQCFIEKDRKDVALEIIKAWWNPDLSAISTLTSRPESENSIEITVAWTLTRDFALEIINIGTEHAYKFLSDNIKYFETSTRKAIAMRYIEDGHEDWMKIDRLYDYKVLDKEILIKLIEQWYEYWPSQNITKCVEKCCYCDKEVLDKLVEKWYDFKKYGWLLLLHFNNSFYKSDRSLHKLLICYLAVLILKSWWELKINDIPKEYLTQDFALEIMNIGTEESYKFLAEHIESFDVSTQKILALKYIEAGYRTYVDAMWPQEIINCKEIAISLIEKWQEDELKFRFNCLDVDVIHELKEKKYDFKKLNKGLECFVEKDRKDAALQIIKSWWEPDLCFIPKWDLTKEFASEIINTKQDSWLKALSLAIPFFKASLIDDIVLNLVNAGWWKYVKNEVLKTDHFDNCLNKWFILALLRTVGTTEAWTVLKKFSDLDSEVASIFVKLEELGILAANLESFNNLNSEIAKSLIDWWYKSAVKKNIERFILDDKTINLLNNRKGKSNSQPKTGKLKKLFSSLIGSREEHEAVSDETIKILQELPNFHKEWKDHKDLATDDIREKIIDAADKIPVDIDIDSDWNKIFILKLKNRTLQILIPRLENYTDEKYADEITFDYEYCSAFDFNNKLHKSYIKLWWMDCDDISKRKNKKLAKYVNEKENEWYYIPSKKDMIDILSELWESAGLNIDDERKNAEYRETPILTTMQMLLLMYLIGCPGSYRLSDFEESSDNQQERLIMILSRFYACFEKMGSCARGAGILMIK